MSKNSPCGFDRRFAENRPALNEKTEINLLSISNMQWRLVQTLQLSCKPFTVFQTYYSCRQRIKGSTTQALYTVSTILARYIHILQSPATYIFILFTFVSWDVLPCKIIVSLIALMMDAARTSETSVDNYFTRQYIPEDKSELNTRRRENLKSYLLINQAFRAKSFIMNEVSIIDC
jgi:hypothetical protein